MYFTFDELINGNPKIVDWYKNALQLWDDILKNYDIKETKQFGKLAKELFQKQSLFESKCGGRSTGKEIMAITGIIQFYNLTTGFEEEWDKENTFRKKKARNLYNAILFSGCSVEVKMTAKKVAKFYGLVGS